MRDMGSYTGMYGVECIAYSLRRFAARKGDKSLVAFAGVSPGDSQSGTYDPESNPIEKRGSPHLRRTLFCVVSAYMLNSPKDEPVYKTLDKKRSEGKKWLVFMTAAMNKFLKIYYARVMEQFVKLTASEITSESDKLAESALDLAV